MNRFTKLSSRGADLPDNAPDWSFVRDNNLYVINGQHQHLIWDRRELPERHKHADAITAAAGIDICGKPCRLPTIAELTTLIDRSRVDPAIDVGYFESNGDWTWSATPLASDAAYAWGAGFSSGYVWGGGRIYTGFVRAVRSVPPSQ